MLLTGDRGIEITADALGGAPGATLRDLDGNGRADVVLRQSTYNPSYAYLEFEGRLTRTGCTAPEKGNSPAPTSRVHERCYR
jgi:hypothetical protein